ncbi:MAG: hypothetical protein NTV48_02855 [Candidatus Vogelbacteria bacterium]|nr:hypothetical protein [Candidatus Vogelbacteria bacterium]
MGGSTMETEDADTTLKLAQAEHLARNLAQIEDAKRYRALACVMAGRESLTDEELLMWYIEIGFARMFSVAWQGGIDPLNLYYTGLEIRREPTQVDGWKHFVDYLEQLIFHAAEEGEKVCTS